MSIPITRTVMPTPQPDNDQEQYHQWRARWASLLTPKPSVAVLRVPTIDVPDEVHCALDGDGIEHGCWRTELDQFGRHETLIRRFYLWHPDSYRPSKHCVGVGQFEYSYIVPGVGPDAPDEAEVLVRVPIVAALIETARWAEWELENEIGPKTAARLTNVLAPFTTPEEG